jgi:hypothetical protein
MGFNKRLIDQSGGATAVDFSQEDSFGDGTGIAYWSNPASNLVSAGGGRTISEDVGSLSSYSFSPGGGIALHYNNDRVSVNGGVDTNQSYTVAAWIRLTSTGDDAFLFWQLTSSTNQTTAAVQYISNGNYRMQINHKYATNNASSFEFAPNDYTFYNNYYRHYGFVFDKDAGTYNYYINGYSVANGNLDGKAQGTQYTGIMGSRKYNNSFNSSICYMGDIRWYQRALTDAEYLEMAQYDGIP